ncbi:hypothetical protein GCM10027051_36880 [Niabella terrae]
MKKYFVLGFGVCLVIAVTYFSSCTKINLPTELGQDLIPDIDNINTFDTTLEVETYNGIFPAALDSFRTAYSYAHILGNINDPLFGTTDSRIFFQVAPGGTTPFKNKPGSLYLDSVVLVIDHASGFYYGDTLSPMTVQVEEIDPAADFTYDSSYKLQSLLPTTTLLGSKTFIPRSLADSIEVIAVEDTSKVANQLRIRLDDSFGDRLLAYDTIGANDAYSSDSLFRLKFKGLALKATSGNCLLGMYLTSSTASAKLAVYYRYNNTDTPSDIDTAVAEFNFANSANANANYIARDYNGTQVTLGADDNIPDEVVYLQNTPGTFANIKIPGLSGLSNSIIHLAELQMENIYDPSDSAFYVPGNVFLDVYDSTAGAYKLVPYAFGVTTGSSSYILSNYEAFYSVQNSSYPYTYYFKNDPLGNRVKQWRFNITKYTQHIVSDDMPVYGMRLYAPAAVLLPLGDLNPYYTSRLSIPQNSFFGVAGVGRVRIGGGNHPTQKMKLRVVYSRLQ